jgi:hypothetical protein
MFNIETGQGVCLETRTQPSRNPFKLTCKQATATSLQAGFRGKRQLM